MRIRPVILFFCLALPLLAADGEKKPGLIVQIVPGKVNYTLKAVMPRFLNNELVSIVKAGMPVTIIYEIRIFRKGFFLFHLTPEKTINYRKTIEYRIQNNVFTVTTAEQVYRNSELNDILGIFYDTDRIPLAGFQPSADPSEYYLDCRLTTESIDLYPPLSWVMGIVVNYKTKWIRIDLNDTNEKME
jgi:hypothetical protein